MDFSSALANVNWLSVLVAALSSFMLGGLWYGALFDKPWREENGISEEALAQRNPGKTFGGAFILALLAAFNLEMFIGPEAGIAGATAAGFLAGFGWVCALLGILYLFEMRSLKLFAINGGYCCLALTLMGAILGAW